MVTLPFLLCQRKGSFYIWGERWQERKSSQLENICTITTDFFIYKHCTALSWCWAIEGLDNFSFLHVFFWKTALELSWETKVRVWSNVQWCTGVLRPHLKCSGVQWMHSWNFAWFKKLKKKVLISSMVLKHWIKQAAISNWPVMYYHITEYVRLTSFMFLFFFLLAHTVHTLRTRNDWNLNKTRKY